MHWVVGGGRVNRGEGVRELDLGRARVRVPWGEVVLAVVAHY